MAAVFGRLRSALVAFAAAAMLVCALPALAADEDIGGTYLTPFPDGDVYNLTVFGDAFGDGLLGGLADAFSNDPRLVIERRVASIPGVMTRDFDSKIRDLEQDLAQRPLNVAVVMFGQSDRVSLRSSSGRRVPVGSAEWVAEYSRRVDRLMKALKRKNPGVYWVGLPNLSRFEANENAQKMNEAIRERAYLNGYKYIDAYSGFADESGGYSAYGPDLEGKIRVLRQRDGVNFTDAGNKKLAHFVEKELRRDLTQARNSRTVPLLGNEAEQAKVNPDNINKTAAAPSGASLDKADTSAPVVKGPMAMIGGDRSSSVALSGDTKADDSKVTLKVVALGGREETQTIEIVRPAIPASVVALMARRAGAVQSGDLLVDQIAGGLTLMSSITPAGSKGRGRTSPTQAPYFRLLVKGERLQPKPGRADDMTWPIRGGDAASDADGRKSPPPKG
jgi:hypothetical protein